MSRDSRSRAGELTRDDVIEAAAALVAERGFAALSMRTLAERCGVATMTLYRHVRTKEDLLAALADRVLSGLELPVPGTLDWQDEIAAVFRSVHALLLRNPEVADIAVKQPVTGQAAYRGSEVVLGALRRGGIEGEAAASAFATLFAFTLGFVQRQLHTAASETSTVHGGAAFEHLPVDDYENLSRIGPVFLLRHSDRHFEDGLDTILRGLAGKAAKG